MGPGRARGGLRATVARPPSRGGSGRVSRGAGEAAGGAREAEANGRGREAAIGSEELGVSGAGDRRITLRKETVAAEPVPLRFTMPANTVTGGYGGDEELDEDAWRPAGAVPDAGALAAAAESHDAGTGGDEVPGAFPRRRAYVIETDSSRPDLKPEPRFATGISVSAGVDCQTVGDGGGGGTGL